MRRGNSTADNVNIKVQSRKLVFCERIQMFKNEMNLDIISFIIFIYYIYILPLELEGVKLPLYKVAV